VVNMTAPAGMIFSYHIHSQRLTSPLPRVENPLGEPHLRVRKTAPAGLITAPASRQHRTCESEKPHLRVAYLEQETQEVFRRFLLKRDNRSRFAVKLANPEKIT